MQRLDKIEKVVYPKQREKLEKIKFENKIKSVRGNHK